MQFLALAALVATLVSARPLHTFHTTTLGGPRTSAHHVGLDVETDTQIHIIKTHEDKGHGDSRHAHQVLVVETSISKSSQNHAPQSKKVVQLIPLDSFDGPEDIKEWRMWVKKWKTVHERPSFDADALKRWRQGFLDRFKKVSLSASGSWGVVSGTWSTPSLRHGTETPYSDVLGHNGSGVESTTTQCGSQVTRSGWRRHGSRAAAFGGPLRDVVGFWRNLVWVILGVAGGIVTARLAISIAEVLVPDVDGDEEMGGGKVLDEWACTDDKAVLESLRTRELL